MICVGAQRGFQFENSPEETVSDPACLRGKYLQMALSTVTTAEITKPQGPVRVTYPTPKPMLFAPYYSIF
jgi:hypothetical protein